MSLINDIKRAARITNDALDEEIERLEEWAQYELIRAGVPDTVFNSEVTNPLLKQAIISGVLTQLLDTAEDRAEAKEAWDYQRDVLRKHEWGD